MGRGIRFPRDGVVGLGKGKSHALQVKRDQRIEARKAKRLAKRGKKA